MTKKSLKMLPQMVADEQKRFKPECLYLNVITKHIIEIFKYNSQVMI